MSVIQHRRSFLAALSAATTASLLGGLASSAQEGPPEITTIRLAKIPGVCIAPQFVAEDLLKSEGFTDVQYVECGAQRLSGLRRQQSRYQHGFRGTIHRSGRR